MTSDEKSKSFAGGVDADRDEKKKKEKKKIQDVRGKNGDENVRPGFYQTFTTYFALFVSFRGLFDFFFFKIYLSLKDEFLIEI